MKAFSPLTPLPSDRDAASAFSASPSSDRFAVGEKPFRATGSELSGPRPGARVNLAATALGTPTRKASPGGVYLFPVSSSTVLLSLNQLAVMSQNGVEIAEAVGHVADHCQDPRLAASLDAIHLALSGGMTFSNAVATHGQYFPASLPAMLAAAEATGDVPQTLADVCERMRGQLEMRASIVGAMIYPVILIAAASVVMTALILGVLPQFGRVFQSTGRPVPASTQFLLDVGTFGRAYWMILFPVGFAILAGAFMLRRHALVQRPLGKMLLYAPMIKDAYRPLIAGRYFRTIAAMVRGGVPMLQAVQLTRDTVQDRSWHELLGRVEDNLIDGLSASEALATADFLPTEATQMMATGERTGRVAEVLDDIGRFYEQEGGRKIKRLVVALEPMIILLMGVLVAGIVMSVMLPLLDVSTIQKG
ncbi:type II secretion system F family protein [Rhodopirellula sp. JC639]|uniref:type II secretion system F family protein n=1 Tax=Stieleria mannarensis TaxID=2755585 RepID=UPI0015FF1E0E|nr:type II secretion system F family protein [Rhodopirellula sp. JC639]